MQETSKINASHRTHTIFTIIKSLHETATFLCSYTNRFAQEKIVMFALGIIFRQHYVTNGGKK